MGKIQHLTDGKIIKNEATPQLKVDLIAQLRILTFAALQPDCIVRA